jgi:hypothetical protein
MFSLHCMLSTCRQLFLHKSLLKKPRIAVETYSYINVRNDRMQYEHLHVDILYRFVYKVRMKLIFLRTTFSELINTSDRYHCLYTYIRQKCSLPRISA